MKVLIVCHGNINRSAAGEIILQRLRPDLEVRSAGLRATPGRITAKRMREALIWAGYATCSIRSSFCTQELIDWADVVMFMDPSNQEKLIESFGLLVMSKSVNLGHLIGQKKIPDPNYAPDGEMHKNVVRMLESALLTWSKEQP